MKAAASGISLALLVFAGLVHGQQKTDPTLDRLTREFAAAFSAKDAAKVAAFYADDAVVMPPDQPMVQGRSSIEAYFRRGFAGDAIDLQLRPMESAIAGAHAFEAGTSILTMGHGSPLPVGGPLTESGKYVVVYKRVGRDWKIAYDIFNSN